MKYSQLNNLLLLLIVWSGSDQVTYLKRKQKQRNEQAWLKKQSKYVGGSLERVTFFAPEGPHSTRMIQRSAFLAKKQSAKANVLICHGYMCDKYDAGLLRPIFSKYNVMTFDFRAHGEQVDDHQTCTFGRDEALDVIAAAQYLKQDPATKDLPTVVYGFSMGAVASIMAQSKNPALFEAMILDCPYDKAENVIKRALFNKKLSVLGYEFEIPFKDALAQYVFHPYLQGALKAVLKTVANLDPTDTNTKIHPVNPANAIKNISVPCFFIHCRNDDKFPIDAVKMVYDGAKGFKRLWITNGRRHFDSVFYNPEAYKHKVNRFIENFLAGDLSKKEQEKIKEDKQV